MSEIHSIIEEYGFNYVGSPDQYWFTFDLNDIDNGYRIETKFNHVIIYHLDDSGNIFNGNMQEPFQFILTNPEDLRVILKTLIVK